MLGIGQQLLDPPCPELSACLADLHVPIPDARDNWDEAFDCATRDVEDLYDALARRGRGHAVPWWSAPRVAWKLLLIGDDDVRCPAVRERLHLVLGTCAIPGHSSGIVVHFLGGARG